MPAPMTTMTLPSTKLTCNVDEIYERTKTMSNEVKLTDEQIETAVILAHDVFNPGSKLATLGCAPSWLRQWKQAVTAAAPHLQAPIAPPTEKETATALETWTVASRQFPYLASMDQVLRQFTATRNTPPPPPDPRREIVHDALVHHAARKCNLLQTSEQFDAATDAILAALDAQS